MESFFRCPLCGQPLQREERTLRCSAGHSYDLSREGYAYLLAVNQKHSLAPGDDPGMAAARRSFLSQGYYAPLLDELCKLSVSHTGDASAVLDAGCGEGYYTSGILSALRQAGKAPRMAGIDISKYALRYAARREKGAEFAVASSYRLPVADARAEVLVNCFSPLAIDEFRRVLRPGGTFLYVVPAAEHLWELKQVLYDAPYPNEEQTVPYDGFSLETVVPVAGRIALHRREDIQNLFRMTPYYWKTPRQGAARLEELETLTTRIAFHIHVFRRESSAFRGARPPLGTRKGEAL